MANFMGVSSCQVPAPAAASARSSRAAGDRDATVDLDPIALDHRIREQLVGDLGGQRARLVGDVDVELELEVLALPHVADAGVAHRVQRLGDRLPLRIEDRWLQRDEHSGFHRSQSPLKRLGHALTPTGVGAEHAVEDRVDVAQLVVEVERLLDLRRRQHLRRGRRRRAAAP